MSLVVNTNLSAITIQKNLSRTQSALSQSFDRLSSGLRITKAADDAAGLAVSEKLRAEIRSLEQAGRNANDGVSMLSSAEGALNEVSSILIRMKELSVQAASGHLSDTDRGYLHSEFQALVTEIDRIAEVTTFNGRSLIDGSLSTGVTFQVGSTAGGANEITFSIGDMHSAQLGTTAANLATQTISTASSAQAAMSIIDAAIEEVVGVRGGLGAVQNRFGVVMNNLAASVENLNAANSAIRDTDVARETAQLTRNQILSQAGVAVLAQANQQPQLALSLLRG